MSESQKIKDIPSIKKILEQTEQVSNFEEAWPTLKPFFRLLGIDAQSVEESLNQVPEIREEIEELSKVPDRFNDLFAEKGWIIYENFDLETAKDAIKLAEAGNIDEAEQSLIEYYDRETIKRYLKRMVSIEAFKPRLDLAQQALNDYYEERYHSCVPVVLALMDGLVQEIKNISFFAENSDLTAYDSIAAHSKGLEKLQKIFNEGRKKTRKERIELPYRNGILHGMDLGYDNKKVAAKTWGALFATAEWARKIESDIPQGSAQESDVNFNEVFNQIEENERIKKELDEWSPREIVVGENVPDTGKPEDYPEDTPEEALIRFLYYWEQENYGCMAEIARSNFSEGITEKPGEIREQFDWRNLESYQLTNITDKAAAKTVIDAHLSISVSGNEEEKEATIRLNSIDENGDPVIRGKEGGTWLINNWLSF